MGEGIVASEVIAPGMRVRCRDAEWLVTRVESSTDSLRRHFAVHCLGVDELVRGHPAIFLTQLDQIDRIDPAAVKLREDRSTGFESARLFLEAQLRSMPITSAEPDLDDMGVFTPLQYQEDAVRLALSQLRPRLLIADAVGLGKTIQLGMILSELQRRGRANRVLVLTKKSMLTQFQSELWNRFSFPLVRLDSRGIQKLRLRIPASKNPFEVYHRVIMSIDTLKDVGRYRHFLEDTRWDVVIIDEAHNVAGANVPERHFSYRLARLLARKTDALFLTTATPHNGKPETFGRLISLLDPSLIPDPSLKEYKPEHIKGHFLMRFKEDIKAQAGENFPERKVVPTQETSIGASEAEISVYRGLAKLREFGKKRKEKGKRADTLLEYGLYKLFLSSPESARKTISQRLGKASVEKDADESNILSEIQAALRNLKLSSTSRYALLKSELQKIGWDGKKGSPRILIFTEFRETQDALAAALAADFNLEFDSDQSKQASQSIGVIHGSFNDISLMSTVEAFVTGSSPMRMLIATDVASEGINLHHECHNVIHFDLPWSIITLIQRNGRIDRFGQKNTPVIRYLMVRTPEGLLKGDEEIFQRLIDKVEEINRSTREGQSVLRLYDSQLEEQFVAEHGILPGNVNVLEGVAAEPQSKAAEKLEQEIRQASLSDHSALLNFLLGDAEPAKPAPHAVASGKRLRLLTDSEFLSRSYKLLSEIGGKFPAIEVTKKLVLISPPEDLRRYLGDPSLKDDIIFGGTALPEEAFPDDGQFRLSESSDQVALAIQAARNTKGYWSREGLCTDQHPILKWITERLLMLVPRGEAPFVTSPYLPKREVTFCFIGQVSSKAGAPLITDPHAISFGLNGEFRARSLNDALAEAKFMDIPNSGDLSSIKGAQALVSSAVAESVKRMKELSEKRVGELRGKITREERRLKNWERERRGILEAKLKELSGLPAKKRYEQELQEIEKLIKDRKENWLETNFKASPEPTTQLVLVIGGTK